MNEVCAKETEVHTVKLETLSVFLCLLACFMSSIQSETVFIGGLNASPSLEWKPL